MNDLKKVHRPLLFNPLVENNAEISGIHRHFVLANDSQMLDGEPLLR